MKVIISQGHGKLHMNETAASLKEKQAGILYITGWLPKNLSPKFVNAIGSMLKKGNLYKLLMQRHPKGLTNEEIASCSFSEFLYWGLLFLTKIKIITYDTAVTTGWVFFGKATKKYITPSTIFHVRSGAGQGGSIQKAKRMGMVVVADHSIAHPHSMANYLRPEYEKFNRTFDLDPNTKFSTLILKDCLDADYIVVNSDFVKDTFIENGFAKEKIKVVYLGVRNDFFYLKDSWEIKTKEIRLLFTGTFGLRKGARIIIEALKILNEKQYNIILDVVGAKEDFKNTNLIDLPLNINFHGPLLQEQLKKFLQESDIYVFPTFAEGCARSAMEAMAAGLPVVTTANCGLPITHGESGIIIPVNDSNALANGIELLINTKELRESIGKKAAALVATNYTWEEYGTQLIDFYKEITSKGV